MRRGIELWPHQLITGKTVLILPSTISFRSHLVTKHVDLNAPPNYVIRQERQAATTQSWLSWAENREVDEWIQNVAGILEQGWNDQ